MFEVNLTTRDGENSDSWCYDSSSKILTENELGAFAMRLPLQAKRRMTATLICWNSRRKWRLTLFCFLMLFISVPAFGFCFEPHPTVTCVFLNSDDVFTGKVLSARAVDAGDAWEYRVSVLQRFRGQGNNIIDLQTGNDSGGYFLDVNREYLIFASSYKGQLWISNCDDSAPLPEAKDLIRKIEGIAIPQDGIIEGRVILNYVPSNKSVPGIQVLVRGEGRTFRLTTDQQGWFRLHVPPGRYSAEAESTPAHPIVAFDLNYGGDPHEFVVKAGRCAGFLFVANPIYKY